MYRTRYKSVTALIIFGLLADPLSAFAQPGSAPTVALNRAQHQTSFLSEALIPALTQFQFRSFNLGSRLQTISRAVSIARHAQSHVTRNLVGDRLAFLFEMPTRADFSIRMKHLMTAWGYSIKSPNDTAWRLIFSRAFEAYRADPRSRNAPSIAVSDVLVAVGTAGYEEVHPWWALVSVMENKVVFHEAFLRWLQVIAPGDGMIPMLMEIIGHENVERGGGSHEAALAQFPRSALVERALVESLDEAQEILRRPPPDHWDSSWKSPGFHDLALAEHLLSKLSSGTQEHGNATTGNHFLDLCRNLGVDAGAMFRAIYFRHPELGAAILAGVGMTRHLALAEALQPLADPIRTGVGLAARLVGAALNMYASAEMSSDGKYPSKKIVAGDRTFWMSFTLGGLSGVFGHFADPENALSVLRRLRPGELTLQVVAILEFIQTQQMRKLVQESFQTILSTLLTERRDLFERRFDVEMMSRLEAVASHSQPRGHIMAPATQPNVRKIFHFGGKQKADGDQTLAAVLGNKGAQLAEMTNLGLRVPPGFTLDDARTRRILVALTLPPDLREEIAEALHQLEQAIKASYSEELRLGDARRPLLLAVRGGAQESKPGFYPTVHHVGLHRSNLEAYSRRLGNPFQARMDYIRHIMDYFMLVDSGKNPGRDPLPSEFEQLAQQNPFSEAYREHQFELLSNFGTLKELDAFMDRAEGIYIHLMARKFPRPAQQLYEAIAAVARRYPPQAKGLAVNIQQEIAGNIQDGHSLSGVMFSRNLVTGERELVGSFRFAMEGREIVTPYSYDQSWEGVTRQVAREMRYADLWPLLPQAYEEFLRGAQLLENHRMAIQDMEVVVEKGIGYFLQTRDAHKAATPVSHLRSLVDLVHEGRLSEEIAASEIEEADLKWVIDYYEQPVIETKDHSKLIGTGMPLFPGIAEAPLMVGPPPEEGSHADAIYAIETPFELAAEAGEYNRILANGVAGILVARGGYADHVALALRMVNKRIPYVVLPFVSASTDGIWTGQQFLKNGVHIVMDGNSGNIYSRLDPEDFRESEIMQVKSGQRASADSELWPYYQTAQRWLAMRTGGQSSQLTIQALATWRDQWIASLNREGWGFFAGPVRLLFAWLSAVLEIPLTFFPKHFVALHRLQDQILAHRAVRIILWGSLVVALLTLGSATGDPRGLLGAALRNALLANVILHGVMNTFQLFRSRARQQAAPALRSFVSAA